MLLRKVIRWKPPGPSPSVDEELYLIVRRPERGKLELVRVDREKMLTAFRSSGWDVELSNGRHVTRRLQRRST